MDFIARIEIPKNSYFKYELNKNYTNLVVDRVLSIPCPFNYGFMEDCPIQADGDPLDVFVISAEPLVSLSQVKIRPLGIFLCQDQGVEDNKVVGEIEGDFYKDYNYIKAIRFYLENYKPGFKILEYKVFNDMILFKNFIEGKKECM